VDRRGVVREPAGLDSPEPAMIRRSVAFAVLAIALAAPAAASAQSTGAIQRQVQSAAERAAREAAEKAAREAIERAGRAMDRSSSSTPAAAPAAAAPAGASVLARPGEVLAAPTGSVPGGPCAPAAAPSLGAEADKVVAFVRASPVFALPGVCPVIAAAQVPAGLEAGHATRSGFTLSAATGPALTVRINTVPDLSAASPIRGSDRAGSFFALPAQTGVFQGFPVHGEMLVVTRNAGPVWRPVDQLRLMTWFIAQQDAALATAAPADRPAIEARRKAVQSRRAWVSAGAGGGCLIADAANPAIPGDVGPDTGANCTWRMVEPNPGYIDKAAGADVVQLVVIDGFEASKPAAAAPAADVGRWTRAHAVWGRDWQAFRKDVMGGR
jgi:hypothetical protein